MQGLVQTMWKLWFHKVKFLNYIKSGNMVYKLGKKSGQLSTKLGKIGTLHIVSI